MFSKTFRLPKKTKLLFQLIISSLIFFLLTSQADSTHQNTKSEIKTLNIDYNTHSVLRGRAVKGIIEHGEVSIYAISNGIPDSFPILNGTTDASGNFSITIPDELALESFYVEVKASTNAANPSLMLCDSFNGCAIRDSLKTDFGETFTLKNNFLLRSFAEYNPLNNSFEVKLTPLEHMAVAYAESLPNGLTANNFRTALAYLSNILLFSSSIQSIAAIDLTSVEETSSASDEEITAAIISSAFLNIDNKLLQAEDIETVLENLSRQKGILSKTSQNDSTDISLATIAEKSLSNIPTHLENRPKIREHLERIKTSANDGNADSVLLNLEAGPGGKIFSPSHEFECTGSCQYNVAQNELIKLEASPDSNSNFKSWNGTCPGLNGQTQTSCNTIMPGNQTIVAEFIAASAAAPSSSNYSILVSDNTDRSSPEDLQLNTVSGNAYILVREDPSIKQVNFYLDTTTGTPYRTENNAPYDMSGPNRNGTANAFDTTTLNDGSHFVYAAIVLTNGSVIKLKAFFTVKNSTAPIEYITLDISVKGPGSVSQANTKLCQTDSCSFRLPKGTMLNLTATPLDSETHAFLGWQGLCDGTGSCVRLIDTDQAIAASFIELSPDTPISAAPQKNIELALSPNPDRLNPMPLEASTLSGLAYIFVTADPGIKQVNFYLDTTTGTPYRTENNAPYDISGGNSDGAAIGLDTTTLSDGNHFVYAAVALIDGSVITLKASFKVENTSSIEYVTLDISINGSGSVFQANTKLCQTATCSFRLPKGTMLNLTAAPLDSETHAFSGWQGLCEGTGDCIHTINTDQAITASFTAIYQKPKEPFTLVVSQNQDRSNPALLESSRLSGLNYIELQSTIKIKQVAFFLNSNADLQNTPLKIENNAPYDFLGSDGNGNAKSFDTSTLPDGSHYISALITLEDDTEVSVRSGFNTSNTIKNSISWSPPEKRASGATLTENEITKYIIYYGKSSRSYTGSIEVSQRDSNNRLPTNVSINHLDPGITYYFAGVTVDSKGLTSALSNEISKLVEGLTN